MSETLRFVTNPSLRVNRYGTRVSIEFPYQASRLDLNAQILDILGCFQEPRTIEDVRKEIRFGDDVATLLQERFLILEEAEAPILMRGLLRPSDQPVGQLLTWAGLRSYLDHRRGCVIGIPDACYSIGNSSPVGGPESIRRCLKIFYAPGSGVASSESSLDGNRRLYDYNRLKVFDLDHVIPRDLGNICFDPQEEDVSRLAYKVHKVIPEVIGRGLVPLVLAGDHSVTYHVLSAIDKLIPEFGVIHFDAHTDMYPNPMTSSKNPTAGDVMLHVLELRSLRKILQLGTREFFVTPQGCTLKQDRRVDRYSSRELKALTLEQVFGSLPREIPYYLTFDVDVIDPSIAPEVRYPVFGGLSFYEGFALIEHAIRHYNIIGLDFVEVRGTSSGNNLAATVAANYITAALLDLHKSVALERNSVPHTVTGGL